MVSDHEAEELPLSGGCVTGVVRVGDTVRRQQGRWSAAVHDVLRYLATVGFDGAPRLIGIDHDDREVLTWIEGDAATRPWPRALLENHGLASLGRLLRRYHEAVADYRPPDDAVWWTGRRRLGRGEIVRHGDLGPWNTIWSNEAPVAFIDWDFAEPGLPVQDLAELAFFAVPMRDDAHCVECGFKTVPDRRHRFGALLDAYGWDDAHAVLDAAERLWEVDIRRIETLGPRGVTPWDGFLARGLVEANGELLRWLGANRHLME